VSSLTGYCRALCFALILFAMGTQFSGVRSEVETIGPKVPPRKSDCEIRIIDKTKDDQQQNKDEARVEPKYAEVARITVYVRRNKLTQGRQAALEEALPELKKQACKAGADALIVLHKRISSSGEFKLLYVRALAVRFGGDSES
jgi:hypothetical protein